MLNYRIRGITPPNVSQAEDTPSPTVQTTNLHPMVTAHRVAQIIGKAHLGDFLYGFDTSRLRRHWPTFEFLKSGPPRIKANPIALAEYFPSELKLEDSKLWEPLVLFAEHQQAMRGDLNRIIQFLEKFENPSVVETFTPLGCAFAAHFFRTSQWFTENRNEIWRKVLASPVASFIACSAGVWPAEISALIHATAPHPLLLAQIYTESVSHQYVETETLLPIFETDPHLEFWIAAQMHGPEETFTALMKRFLAAADQHPIPAGFCLGLFPDHSQANHWKTLTAQQPLAIYWALKTAQTNFAPSQVHWPFWDELIYKLRDTPQWVYHLARDLDHRFASDYVRLIWPNPWAIEIIEDLHLPCDLFMDLLHEINQNPDHEDPLISSLILWGADYVIKGVAEPADSTDNED